MRIKRASEDIGFGPDFIKRLERDGRIPPIPRDSNGHRRLTPQLIAAIREAAFRTGRNVSRRPPRPSVEAETRDTGR
jgi:hypothetical protein